MCIEKGRHNGITDNDIAEFEGGQVMPVAHESGDYRCNIRIRVPSIFIVEVVIVNGETEALEKMFVG